MRNKWIQQNLGELLSNRLAEMAFWRGFKASLDALKFEVGGYGEIRTYDPSIMSAVL